MKSLMLIVLVLKVRIGVSKNQCQDRQDQIGFMQVAGNVRFGASASTLVRHSPKHAQHTDSASNLVRQTKNDVGEHDSKKQEHEPAPRADGKTYLPEFPLKVLQAVAKANRIHDGAAERRLRDAKPARTVGASGGLSAVTVPLVTGVTLFNDAGFEYGCDELVLSRDIAYGVDSRIAFVGGKDAPQFLEDNVDARSWNIHYGGKALIRGELITYYYIESKYAANWDKRWLSGGPSCATSAVEVGTRGSDGEKWVFVGPVLEKGKVTCNGMYKMTTLARFSSETCADSFLQPVGVCEWQLGFDDTPNERTKQWIINKPLPIDGPAWAPLSDCGKKGSVPGVNVINGNEADRCEWPWQVNLHVTVNYPSCGKYAVSQCGGTLIDSKWVLTAGHCVYDSCESTTVVATDNLDATLGTIQRHNSDNKRSHVQTATVAKVVVHPDFDIYTMEFDFALLELSTPVEITSCVRPACMPSDEVSEGDTCWVTGWGRGADLANRPEEMLEGEVKVLSDANCEKIYGDDLPGQVCIKGGTTKDDHVTTCMGDSGGPLSCEVDDETFAVQGVVSFGTADCAEASAAQSVYDVRHWVLETIAPVTPPMTPTPAPVVSSPAPYIESPSPGYCQPWDSEGEFCKGENMKSRLCSCNGASESTGYYLPADCDEACAISRCNEAWGCKGMTYSVSRKAFKLKSKVAYVTASSDYRCFLKPYEEVSKTGYCKPWGSSGGDLCRGGYGGDACEGATSNTKWYLPSSCHLACAIYRCNSDTNCVGFTTKKAKKQTAPTYKLKSEITKVKETGDYECWRKPS